MRYFCYRNLHKKGVVYSMKSMESHLVELYKSVIFLKDVKLKVSKSGNARVRLEKRKNVHAGVQGELVERLPENSLWRKARYNPYEVDTFIDAGTLLPVLTADYIILKEDGLYYSLNTWLDSVEKRCYTELRHLVKDNKLGVGINNV